MSYTYFILIDSLGLWHFALRSPLSAWSSQGPWWSVIRSTFSACTVSLANTVLPPVALGACRWFTSPGCVIVFYDCWMFFLSFRSSRVWTMARYGWYRPAWWCGPCGSTLLYPVGTYECYITCREQCFLPQALSLHMFFVSKTEHRRNPHLIEVDSDHTEPTAWRSNSYFLTKSTDLLENARILRIVY